MGNHTEYLGLKIPEAYSKYLSDSLRFNHRLMIGKKKCYKEPREQFINEIYDELGLRGKNYDTADKKMGLNCILANLVVANKVDKEIALKRGRGDYSNTAFYGLSHYTYANIIPAVDALVKEGYVFKKNGFYDRDAKAGEVSRIRPTEKFLIKLENAQISFDTAYMKRISEGRRQKTPKAQKQNLSRDFIGKIEYRTPILLKDKHKQLISYKLTDRNGKMKNFLLEFNEFTRSTSILIPYTTIIKSKAYINPYLYITEEGDPLYSNSLSLLGIDGSNPLYYINLDGQLYRVFNNCNFGHGGRFYGAEPQIFSEDERKEIRLNGNRTVEIDFKAMHPRMLYHLVGIDYQGDPYKAVMNIEELRKPIKRLMQIMINANNYHQAKGAFNNWLEHEADNAEILMRHGYDTRKLMKLIEEKHQAISKYWNTGYGVVLQNIDSKVAEDILKYFYRAGKAILCIHDSFIVEEQNSFELEMVMQEMYKKRLHFDCELKKPEGK